MIERLFRFVDTDEKTLFWCFWVVVVFWPAVRVAKQLNEYRETAERATPQLVGGAYVLMVAALYLGGKFLWHVLSKERFLFAEKVLSALGGFLVLCIFCGGTILLLSGILIVILDPWMPHAMLMAFQFVTGAFFFAALFLGGCWIGFKMADHVCTLCLLAALLTFVFLQLNPMTNIGYSLLIAGLIIAGGYASRRRFSRGEQIN